MHMNVIDSPIISDSAASAVYRSIDIVSIVIDNMMSMFLLKNFILFYFRNLRTGHRTIFDSRHTHTRQKA